MAVQMKEGVNECGRQLLACDREKSEGVVRSGLRTSKQGACAKLASRSRWKDDGRANETASTCL
jgi:hypothetical protein